MKKYLLIFICFISIASYSQSNLDSCLIAFYPFNGNTNDQSGSNNNGLLFGASLANDRFDNPNSAYYFNGVDNYIFVPTKILPDSCTSFSVAFWFKSFNTEGGCLIADWIDSITERHNYNFEAIWNLDYNTPDILYHYRTNGCASGTGGNYGPMWNFIAITCSYSEGTVILETYKSPGLHKSTTFNYDCGLNPSGLTYIGKEANHSTSTRFFNGLIDDIRIYNRVISSSEVEQLYNDNTSSVMLNEQIGLINVYPNPTNNFVNIDCKHQLWVEFYNTFGKVVHTSTDRRIDISMLSTGVYFIKLFEENHQLIKTVKIIVK